MTHQANPAGPLCETETARDVAPVTHLAADVVRSKPVFVLMGPVPPPVHGMAMVNEAVQTRLLSEGVDCRLANVSAISLDRSIPARLSRLPRVLRELWTMARRPRGSIQVFYTSVSGGAGKVYEIVALAIARAKRLSIVVHHHTFTYIDRYSALMHVLARMAGRNAHHVALSHNMAAGLNSQYGVGRVHVLSNAMFIVREVDRRRLRARADLMTIGFLGNISAEKGVFVFLDLVARLEHEGLRIKAVIAGPFEDAVTEQAVTARVNSLKTVEYLGPVYGEDKATFFGRIDALVFPTRYRNEAEPLVIHEAFANAIPVVAYGRGAIAEVVTAGSGLVVDVSDDFVERATEMLRKWLTDTDTVRTAGEAAMTRYMSIREESETAWGVLMSQLEQEWRRS